MTTDEAERERKRARDREYRLKNKERRAAYQREWAKRNNDKTYKYRLAWSIRNPDKRKAHAKTYREKHAEAVAQRKAAWRERNRVKIREYNRAYALRNGRPGQFRPIPVEPVAYIRAAVRTNDLYARVWAALGGINISLREDLASEAVILLLEDDSVTVDAAIKEARKRHYRLHSNHSTISLDQPTRNGGNWHDILADERAI